VFAGKMKKLKEAFGLDDINKLPLAFNIAWYEQKAVSFFWRCSTWG